MAEIATLVQRYLTISAKPKRLNYYTIFGLDELLDDRTAIALAVEAAIEKLKSADRTTDPVGFEQVVKVVRQARATLLNEDKKRAYDLQLKAKIENDAIASSVGDRPPSESSRLSQLLPKGDPGAPFSMADFLKQPVEQREAETAAQRHVALAELVRTSTQPPSSIVDKSSPVEGVLTPSEELNKSFGINRTFSGNNASRDLKEMIRRNRQKKNLIAASIAIGGSLIVVMIGGWMFVSNQIAISRQKSKIASSLSFANDLQPNVDDSGTLVDVGTTTPDEKKKSRMNLGLETPTTKGKVGTLPQIGNDVDTSMTQTAHPVVDSTPTAPVTPEPTKVPVAAVEPKMVDGPPKPRATDNDNSKWRETMALARKALDTKDFSQFSVEIEKALNLAANDLMEEQSRRLDKFGQLYQKGLAIADESLSELKATDQIHYGSSGGKASVVEVNDKQLIIRILGKNEKFQFDKIPLGILMAVIEPKLNDSAIDQAIRGILLSFDPRSNSANKKQAKEYFDKATALDESFAKLDTVPQEAY